MFPIEILQILFLFVGDMLWLSEWGEAHLFFETGHFECHVGFLVCWVELGGEEGWVLENVTSLSNFLHFASEFASKAVRELFVRGGCVGAG